ncbi:DUF4314 domain-containing protein [Ruminococcus flavefaciens]|uniref:DUF4314 domain-containing protein n=1 Tax=Ruminococcus flavefaciens TaxID=1265 RepID=UPI00048ADA2A|nr:DUF4314 domain-containing protein [Ruminococcus flavefaciens]
MRLPSKTEIERLRKMYPPGTRIRLIFMSAEPYPLPPGSIGEVELVDDAGNINMKWECGRGLSLIAGVDSFEVIPAAPK